MLNISIDTILSCIGVLVGLAAIVYACYLDSQGKPDLQMHVQDDTKGFEEGNPAQREPCKWLRIWVENKAHKGRALACQGTIAFFHYNDHTCVFPKEMEARWSDGPIPDVHDFHKQMKQLPKEFQNTFNIEPTRQARLDLVIRMKSDDQCYGWNNDGYLYDDYRNPNWRLEPGQYIARVTVGVGSLRFYELFIIHNDVGYELFHHTQVNRNEKKTLLKTLPPIATA